MKEHKLKWQPMGSAPKDCNILLYGTLEGEIEDWSGTPKLTPSQCGKSIVVGYWFVDKGVAKHETLGEQPWDNSRWMLYGCDYYGVTIRPTHWMHEPAKPKSE